MVMSMPVAGTRRSSDAGRSRARYPRARRESVDENGSGGVERARQQNERVDVGVRKSWPWSTADGDQRGFRAFELAHALAITRSTSRACSRSSRFASGRAWNDDRRGSVD
jgi:hypothetical protein